MVMLPTVDESNFVDHIKEYHYKDLSSESPQLWITWHRKLHKAKETSKLDRSYFLTPHDHETQVSEDIPW